jgi:hypothetical protein
MALAVVLDTGTLKNNESVLIRLHPVDCKGRA